MGYPISYHVFGQHNRRRIPPLAQGVNDERDWFRIQLAMVAMKQAELVQVLLPYAVHGERTFFQAFKQSGYAGLLAAPKDDDDVVDAG